KFDIPEYRTNRQITAPELRVVDENGLPLGILKTSEAIRIAEERGFDLVEVSPKAEPPVAKILDHGQFKYQKEKEVRKQKIQSHEVDIKGVRLSVRIGEHDFEIRRQQAKKFLERGDKVRPEIVLRGREKAHAYLADEIITRFVKSLESEFPIRTEQAVTKQGGRVTAIIARS
ncbi:TPA: translation initiation factor IF-3, partial [Candidatus Uhrbacteria bacterium]|nr:translation initiation factor IF-3 [Candidatus Uhrbacteria bacterium]